MSSLWGRLMAPDEDDCGMREDLLLALCPINPGNWYWVRFLQVDWSLLGSVRREALGNPIFIRDFVCEWCYDPFDNVWARTRSCPPIRLHPPGANLIWGTCVRSSNIGNPSLWISYKPSAIHNFGSINIKFFHKKAMKNTGENGIGYHSRLEDTTQLGLLLILVSKFSSQ